MNKGVHVPLGVLSIPSINVQSVEVQLCDVLCCAKTDIIIAYPTYSQLLKCLSRNFTNLNTGFDLNAIL